jgi:hypothetical protein
MRVVLAAAMIASLAAPALAQQQEAPLQYGKEEPEKTQTQKAADKAAVDAYKRSLRAIPDQGPNDPWGGVRSNDGSKPEATKTAKSKAKTSETKPQ